MALAVNNFYTNQTSLDKVSFDLEALFPDKNYSVSTKYLSNPLYEEKGVTYFYDGNLTRKKTMKSGFLKEKHSKVSAYTPKFDPKNGTFQIFLSNNFFYSILSDLSYNMSFIINHNDLNVLSFELNIPFLESILPGN